MENIKDIIESLLFVSKEPLSITRIRRALPFAEAAKIRAALQELSDEYDKRKGGFFLREVAGGFQLRTRPEYKEWISRLIKASPPRLSRSAMETLAIIAWNQPIIRSEIERIRGVDSGGVVRMLIEKNLIRVLGRKEIPGRPMIYATTKQFLEIFDLKDLKDLPTPKEIEEYGDPFPDDDESDGVEKQENTESSDAGEQENPESNDVGEQETGEENDE